MSERTLTLFCATGLSNRLYVLTSGMAIAAACSRAFRMLWPRTPACGAAFQELFANDWPVETADMRVVAKSPYAWSLHQPDPPNLLAAADDHLVLGSHRTLVRPDLFPDHAALTHACLAEFRRLQPIPAIAEMVAQFRTQHFRPAMIGVHLRRGDFIKVRPDLMENTLQAIGAVETALAHMPEAGIFLATDDDPGPGKGVRAAFTRRFGKRVVWTTPRSLDRSSVAAVQDGLVDLCLLRQTDHFVGSVGSAFSRLAVYGLDVPHTFCRGSSSGYRRALWLYRVSGIYWLVRRLGRHEFQRNLAFPTLLRYYRAAPSRLLYSLLRRRSASEGELFSQGASS